MRYISPISRTYPRSGESRLWAVPGAYRYRSVHDGAAAWPGALAKLGYHLTYANSRIGPPSSRDPFSLRLPLSLSLSLSHPPPHEGARALRYPPTYAPLLCIFAESLDYSLIHLLALSRYRP